MDRISGLTKFLFAIVIIGAINWGLVGFFNWNLVNALFGAGTALSRIFYAVVGLCGIGVLFVLPRLREASEVRQRPLIPPTTTTGLRP